MVFLKQVPNLLQNRQILHFRGNRLKTSLGNFLVWRKSISKIFSSIPESGYLMFSAAVSLFWNTNMAAMTSCTYTRFEAFVRRLSVSYSILILCAVDKPLTFWIWGSMYNNSALLRRHLWFTRWRLWLLGLGLWLGLWLWLGWLLALRLWLWFRLWESLLFWRDSGWIYIYKKGRGYLLVRELTDVFFDSEDH